jgi:hypothetical protein
MKLASAKTAYNRGSDPTFSFARPALLQRKCACGRHTIAGGECEACRRSGGRDGATAPVAAAETVRPSVARTADHPDAEPANVSQFARGIANGHHGGMTPPASVRADVERERGVDLSPVRVHVGAQSAAAAGNIGASAFTHGASIHFGDGAYRPGTTAGDSLLRHELHHVADFLAGGGGDVSPRFLRYPNKQQAGKADDFLAIVRRVEAANKSAKPLDVLKKLAAHVEEHNRDLASFRYFETRRHGWIDIVHFCAAAKMAASIPLVGEVVTDVLGLVNEVVQWSTEWGSDYRSGFSPEDIPSNSAGSTFGDDVFEPDGGALSAQLSSYLNSIGTVDQAGSKTYPTLPATDPGGAPSGTSAAASQPSPPGERAKCEPKHLGGGAYMREDCIVVQVGGPKL